jgi:hypothetical protein
MDDAAQLALGRTESGQFRLASVFLEVARAGLPTLPIFAVRIITLRKICMLFFRLIFFGTILQQIEAI